MVTPAVANSTKISETTTFGLTNLQTGDVVRMSFLKEAGNSPDGLDLLLLGEGSGYTCDAVTGAITFLSAQCN